jgi:hypothetical protein
MERARSCSGTSWSPQSTSSRRWSPCRRLPWGLWRSRNSRCWSCELWPMAKPGHPWSVATLPLTSFSLTIQLHPVFVLRVMVLGIVPRYRPKPWGIRSKSSPGDLSKMSWRNLVMEVANLQRPSSRLLGVLPSPVSLKQAAPIIILEHCKKEAN